MKVLHLITGLDIGGAEMMLYHLCKQQKKAGDEPIVISMKSAGEIRDLLIALGISVYSLNFPKGKFSFSGFLTLIKKIIELKPNILHCWMYHANLVGSLASIFINGLPVVWSIHNTVLSKENSSLLTIFIMRMAGLLSFLPDRIIYCSKMAKILHEGYFYNKKKGLFIPNGVDIDLFSPSMEYSAADELSNKTKSNRINIGIIARYDAQKDFSTFISASKLIIQSGKRVQFTMCGPGLNESNLELIKLIEQGTDPTRFTLLGPRNDIPEILNSLDIFILTSVSEAFPIVLAEAMACGVPCVSTDVGDAAYIVGKAGKIVPVKNPQAIADAVSAYMQMPQEDLQEIKKAARSRVVEKFSLQKIADMYKADYEEIINRK